MKLDRALIKTQSKQLIKGRILVLFVITLIVTTLAGGAGRFISAAQNYGDLDSVKSLQRYSQRAPKINDFDELEDYLDDFDDYLENNEQPKKHVAGKTLVNLLQRLAFIAGIIFSPLSILLCGVYLMLIRGNALELYDEFEYVFKNAFDKNYFNKLLLCVLKQLFTFLWSLLFVIPGVIYAYKVYFAEYIQADYPELTWKDCLVLSKKMTSGHKGELFVFDLSYIPWFLLVGVSFGIASIYVTPYYLTAKTLYYENFKQRALATGELTQSDFMTEAQKYAEFVKNNPAPAGGYYAPLPHAPMSSYEQAQQKAYNPYPPVQPQPNAPLNNTYQPPVNSESVFPAALESENNNNETF